MIRFIAATAALLFLGAAWTPAAAQTTQGQVVSVCGTPNGTPQVGKPFPLTVDQTAVLCTQGGSSGGGAVTIADGADVTQGHIADATVASGSSGTVEAYLRTIKDAAVSTAPTPVKIDQTTPGTTNNVTVSTNAIASAPTIGIIQATASAPITSTSATTTLVVAASGSTKVYITHYDWVLSGAGTVALIAGTGATCGGGTHYLTGASGHTASFAANGGIATGSGLGPILITAASEAVCIITTGAVDTAGSLSYAQF